MLNSEPQMTDEFWKYVDQKDPDGSEYDLDTLEEMFLLEQKGESPVEYIYQPKQGATTCADKEPTKEEKVLKLLFDEGQTTWAYEHPQNSDNVILASQIGNGHRFFCPNPMQKKRSNNNVASHQCLFADMDIKDWRKAHSIDSSVPDMEVLNQMKEHIRSNKDLITAAVWTGRAGYHTYTRLTKPLDKDTWQEYQNKYLAYFYADPAAKDASRMLRVPGSTREPDDSKDYQGGDMVTIKLLSDRKDVGYVANWLDQWAELTNYVAPTTMVTGKITMPITTLSLDQRQVLDRRHKAWSIAEGFEASMERKDKGDEIGLAYVGYLKTQCHLNKNEAAYILSKTRKGINNHTWVQTTIDKVFNNAFSLETKEHLDHLQSYVQNYTESRILTSELAKAIQGWEWVRYTSSAYPIIERAVEAGVVFRDRNKGRDWITTLNPVSDKVIDGTTWMSQEVNPLGERLKWINDDALTSAIKIFPRKVINLVNETSGGKTHMAINIICQALRQGKKAMYVWFEGDDDEIKDLFCQTLKCDRKMFASKYGENLIIHKGRKLSFNLLEETLRGSNPTVCCVDYLKPSRLKEEDRAAQSQALDNIVDAFRSMVDDGTIDTSVFLFYQMDDAFDDDNPRKQKAQKIVGASSSAWMTGSHYTFVCYDTGTPLTDPASGNSKVTDLWKVRKWKKELGIPKNYRFFITTDITQNKIIDSGEQTTL